MANPSVPVSTDFCTHFQQQRMVHLFLRGEPLLVAGKPAPIQAVLFDKDGTISRSEPKLLALATTRIQHCLSLAGSDSRGQLKDLLERAYGVQVHGGSLDPAGITAVAARDHNLVSTAVVFTLLGHSWPEAFGLAQESFRLADLDQPPCSVPSPMTEGLGDLLADLRRFAVPCAVISNDDCTGILNFLGHHGLRQQFAAIWSAEHRPRKPDPQAIHHLCEALGVPPSHCALIGDANSDLVMARSAGVAVVLGYRGGWQRPVDLEPGYPLMDHWGELLVEECSEPAQVVSTET